MDVPGQSSAEPPDLSVRASELPLDPRSHGRTLTLRDDRLDFVSFGDAAASCRARRARLRLIDQGRFSVRELEWLAEAGADIYTSDRAGRELSGLVLIRGAARRGRAILAHFQHGPLEAGEAPAAVSLAALREMRRSGVDIYISNGTVPRDPAVLAEEACEGAKGGAVFVYYHHGALDPALENLARRGAWVHLLNASLSSGDDVRFLGDCVRAARAANSNFILHIESAPDPVLLADSAATGAVLLFKTPRSDYRSPLRPLEEAARRRRLASRAFFLFTDYLL